MRIHILGAAGAGKTTLGIALGQALKMPHFNSDDYFWETGHEPFTVRRDPVIRNAMILADLKKSNNWVLEGSMVSWGINWNELLDAVVFLYIPPQVRMQRLHNREIERYGEAITANADRAVKYQEFMDWARGYDDNSTKGRTLQVHQDWMKLIKCPILEIHGDTTTEERIARITDFIKQ